MKSHGFTLVELLVVLVIMAVVSGMAVVQMMPDDRSRLREEARRLALLLENATLEARASGHSLAWSPEAGGYRFWQLDRYGEWKNVVEPMFRRRELPEAMLITEVGVEERTIMAGEKLLFGPASFPTPFVIRLRMGKVEAAVTGNATGETQVRLNTSDGPL